MCIPCKVFVHFLINKIRKLQHNYTLAPTLFSLHTTIDQSADSCHGRALQGQNAFMYHTYNLLTLTSWQPVKTSRLFGKKKKRCPCPALQPTTTIFFNKGRKGRHHENTNEHKATASQSQLLFFGSFFLPHFTITERPPQGKQKAELSLSSSVEKLSARANTMIYGKNRRSPKPSPAQFVLPWWWWWW